MKPSQHWFGSIIAAFSGVLVSMCFPGYHFPTLGLPYLIAVAFLPLFFVLFTLKGKHPARAAFFYIWIFGFVFQLGAFFWISQPIVYFSSLPDYIAYPLWVLGSSLQSLYFVILFSPLLFNVWLSHKYPNKKIPLVLLALFITALEVMIPRFFDWSIGQLPNNIYLWQIASLFGFNTATFFIMFTNLTFAYALAHYRDIIFFKKMLFLNVLIWSGIFIFGYLRIQFLDSAIAQSPKIRVAYIQPNFTFQELASKRIHAKNAHEATIGTVLAMSSQVIAKSLAYDKKTPDLLIWPESVSPDNIFVNPALQETVINYLKIWHVPILLQDTIRKYKNPTDTRLSIWSVSKILTVNGLGPDSYEKWVPIPFGEELPLERVFPKLGAFYRNIFSNSSKVEVGTSYDALNVQDKFYVAPLICFDSIYQKLPYLQTKFGGANFFVNQANFMWMVDSNAGLEFSWLNKARTIENARSMVMVSNTGPTMAFDPLGRIIYGPTELLSSESGFIDIPLYDGKTLFYYVYNWPILILALFGVYKVVLLLRSKSS